jgi:hypothetical protein
MRAYNEAFISRSRENSAIMKVDVCVHIRAIALVLKPAENPEFSASKMVRVIAFCLGGAEGIRCQKA